MTFHAWLQGNTDSTNTRYWGIVNRRSRLISQQKYLWHKGQGEKQFEKMRSNPRDNWDIDDVRVVCNEFGSTLRAPSRGSNYKVAHPGQSEILTIPARRPIKPVYIRMFVEFVDKIQGKSQ